MADETDEPTTLAEQSEEFHEAIIELRNEILASLPFADRQTVERRSDDISLLDDFAKYLAPVVVAHFGAIFGAYAGYRLGLGRDVSVGVGGVLGLLAAGVVLWYIFFRQE